MKLSARRRQAENVSWQLRFERKPYRSRAMKELEGKISASVNEETLRRFSVKSRRIVRTPAVVVPFRSESCAILRGIDWRTAAPAGEPFPTRFDKIRRPIVPADISHPFGTRPGFDWRGWILHEAGTAGLLRFLSRIFASHIVSFLVWARAPPGAMRPDQEAQGMEPCSSAN